MKHDCVFGEDLDIDEISFASQVRSFLVASLVTVILNIFTGDSYVHKGLQVYKGYTI